MSNSGPALALFAPQHVHVSKGPPLKDEIFETSKSEEFLVLCAPGYHIVFWERALPELPGLLGPPFEPSRRWSATLAPPPRVTPDLPDASQMHPRWFPCTPTPLLTSGRATITSGGALETSPRCLGWVTWVSEKLDFQLFFNSSVFDSEKRSGFSSLRGARICP